MSFPRIFEGVVESRADPLKIGRCKVRVVGVHTENTELLPTIDLPWARPMGAMGSASVSGIGNAPVGLVEGTWVYVFFSDGENYQQPVMMGTIVGIPEEQSQEFTDSQPSTKGTQYENVSDTSGSTGRNSTGSTSNGASNSTGSGSGQQVLTQTESQNQPSRTESDGSYKLGQVSKQYESGKSGPGTVSTGKGDLGGVSYGTHQLASYRNRDGSSKGSGSTNSPVQQFVKGSKYSEDFRGLTPGTVAFSNKWKEVATKDPKGFENAQYEYFKGEYYNRGSNNIKTAGIDLSNRGNAVQEAIWSTSIQYGTGGARKVFVRALDGKDIGSMSDAQIVEAIQNDKLKNVDRDFSSSSSSVRNGIRNRITSEKNDLVKLAGNDGAGNTPEPKKKGSAENTLEQQEKEAEANKPKPTEQDTGKPADSYTEDSEYKAPANATPTSGVRVPSTPSKNTTSGFQDPNNVYPKKDWLNEPDTSRLARNEKTDQTILRAKKNSLVKNVQTAGGKQWNEPESPYAAKYPLNRVFQSESGHVQEFDDTPGAERIHTYHRSGSFVEHHPNGDVVYKNTRDGFDITVRDKNVYVGGSCNITVAGDCNVYTKGVHKMESDGDMFIKTKSNMRIGAGGTLHMESNGEMYAGSKSNFSMAGRNIFLNCGWTASHVAAGGYNAGDIAVEVMYDIAQVVSPLEESKTIESLKKDGSIPPETTEPAKEDPKPTDDKPKEEEKDKEVTECVGCCEFKPEEVAASLKLSDNFKLADLTTSAYYPHAIREQGGRSKHQIAKSLCALTNQVLEPIVKKYGRSSFIITSGFRAGTGSSQHLKGEAVDIQFPGLPESKVPARAEEMSKLVPFDQMIIEYHGNNPVFHISLSTSNRKQKLSTPNLKNYFQGFRNRDMSEPK